KATEKRLPFRSQPVAQSFVARQCPRIRKCADTRNCPFGSQYYRILGSQPARRGRRGGGPVVSGGKVPRRSALRTRFSRNDSPCPRGKHYARRISGEEKPAGVLGTFAQARPSRGYEARLNEADKR